MAGYYRLKLTRMELDELSEIMHNVVANRRDGGACMGRTWFTLRKIAKAAMAGPTKATGRPFPRRTIRNLEEQIGADGTAGQDRSSYTDTQDRKTYGIDAREERHFDAQMERMERQGEVGNG
jgi:hypothetical protein